MEEFIREESGSRLLAGMYNKYSFYEYNEGKCMFCNNCSSTMLGACFATGIYAFLRGSATILYPRDF